MKQISKELDSFIRLYEPMLKQVPEETFSRKESHETWSRKEELGHLIDSAQNNLRRFVVAQYETNPKIVYDQNFWVKAADYQKQPVEHLISFWKLLNLQIAEVLKNTPEVNSLRTCDTGKEKVELHSLRFLAEDYVKHMVHHLHHLLELEAIPY